MEAAEADALVKTLKTKRRKKKKEVGAFKELIIHGLISVTVKIMLTKTESSYNRFYKNIFAYNLLYIDPVVSLLSYSLTLTILFIWIRQ